MTLGDVQSLLDAPSPTVLTTYRRDSSALTTPVWFRFHEDAFEVVLAEGDVKRQHLARTPYSVGRGRLLRLRRVHGITQMRDTHTGDDCRIPEDDRCVREVVEQPHSCA